MAAPMPLFFRGAQGLWSVNGTTFTDNTIKTLDESKTCKCLRFSEDGSLLAWCNAESGYIMDTKTMNIIHDLELPKIVDLKFSPSGAVLAIWNNYVVNRSQGPGQGQGLPNLTLFDSKSGEVKKTLIQKKQIGWAPEWSSDEGICVRNVSNELHFYERNNFDTIANKLHLQKVAAYSLATSRPYVIATYVPGSKGQPSFVRIYRYPNLSGLQASIANKSFYKADRVNFFWNLQGSAVLVLTSTECSDSSYYGEQGLHFLSTTGDTCLVPLQKQGPIYHIEWTFDGKEYILIHGYMPAKVTIYNLKSEPTFDFGTGPRNICAFNPQGTILCIAGFGNLAGNLEFWDFKQKKLIKKTQSADTTHFDWCPDGQHLLTSTTAPRLRVANGHRIWHYSGTLMKQEFTKDHAELWQVQWMPQPKKAAPSFSISTKTVASSVAEQPKEKTMAYRPPHARVTGATPVETKPLEELEQPSSMKKQEPEKGLSKNKKKREARKAKAAQEQPNDNSKPSQAATEAESTGDPEKDKKLRNLRKKVQQIEKLKEQKASGKPMEVNQLEKIKTLDSLLQEIEDLEL